MKLINLSGTDKLLHTTGIHQRLSGAGLACLHPGLACLIDDQDERLAAGDQPSHIPLLWRGLAEAVGLTVDNDGRIIDGPRSAIPGF